MPLILSRRALREIREASEWWDQNRADAPDAFRDTLERAFELIQAEPKMGAYATNVRLQGVRRVHLSRIRYFLYYRFKKVPQATGGPGLWHTSRYPDLDL